MNQKEIRNLEYDAMFRGWGHHLKDGSDPKTWIYGYLLAVRNNQPAPIGPVDDFDEVYIIAPGFADWNMPRKYYQYNANYGTRNRRISSALNKPIAAFKNGKLIKAFDSAKKAAKWCGVKNSTHIGNSAKNQRKSAYGYEWKYIEDSLFIKTYKKLE